MIHIIVLAILFSIMYHFLAPRGERTPHCAPTRLEFPLPPTPPLDWLGGYDDSANLAALIAIHQNARQAALASYSDEGFLFVS